MQADNKNPFRKASPQPTREEWEEWEDDDSPETTIVDEGPLIDLEDHTGPSSKPERRNSLQRYSVQRPVFRTKSKGRQKAKIAKAGIKLDTDVSHFRQTQKAQQDKLGGRISRDAAGNRFADATALKALEGSPNSASIGSFSWLRHKSGQARKKMGAGPEPDLSPDSRPIMIGLAVPSEEMSDHQVSPQTAVVETPAAVRRYNQKSAALKNSPLARTPEQQRSVWSPDTEASESPYNPRSASSFYSQPSINGGNPGAGDAPPVPVLPATYKFKQTQPSAFTEPDDENDADSPCTLFEEDGSSPQATRNKPPKQKASAISPESACTQPSGWWDTVITPFSQTSTTNPFRQTPQQTGESSTSAAVPAPKDWWHDVDEKKRPASRPGLTITAASPAQNTAWLANAAASSSSSSSRSASASRPETQSEKARILLEENKAPTDEPPPYSPLMALGHAKLGVVLTPTQVNHGVNHGQRIPSPGPVSPFIPGTMASQGGIGLSEMITSPRIVPPAVLPDRPVGTFVTHDQFYAASRTDRTERTRRRHEKEEFVARKAGGFWRGRGCIPAEGCFGRTGREGRKRRRLWLAGCCGFFVAIILIIVLSVVLTRKSTTTSHGASTTVSSGGNSQSDQQEPEQSIWLNLTAFPPIPTGVLTVAGPNNTEAVDGCVEGKSSLLWSCSIPKDQQDDLAYGHDQPEFIFQIQYDNNSRALWNVSSTGEQPSRKTRRATSLLGRVADALLPTHSRRAIVYDTGFSPSPDPPDSKEMFFLGNTTDGVVADAKAGEPTPFFISVLASVDATVGPNVVQRRGLGNGIDAAPTGNDTANNLTNILPAPETTDGKTPVPARLFPQSSQQPLRLYDRGLPTEHYGFYAYYNKTIYVADPDGDQLNSKQLDGDGGALLSEATKLVIWSQARFVVKIWTQKGAGSGVLLGADDGSTSSSSSLSANDTRPGTMPYPVTIGTDFHGGDRVDKGTWMWSLVSSTDGDDTNSTSTKVVDRSDPIVVSINNGFEGTWINSSDTSLIDGGTGGCRCAWANFPS